MPMDIKEISQSGFSAYLGSQEGVPGAKGWTCVNADQGGLLISVAEQSPDPAQVFNFYSFDLGQGVQGTGLLLQSCANGKYVAAQTKQINGATHTVFTATADTRDAAAHFGVYGLGTGADFFWYDSASQQWVGLINLETTGYGGNGVVVASDRKYNEPYLLPWKSELPAPAWSFSPPAGWHVGHGSDLSWVDFTAVSSTNFPFDFTNCNLDHVDLTGKTLGYAKFVGCDLRATQLAPPLGASSQAWIDFTGAKINYLSLGPDWRWLNLTQATILDYPQPPDPPPQINAQGTILNHVSLVNWNLPQADFSGAQLINADLTGSNLAGAKFHGACLSPTSSSPASSPGADAAANLPYTYLFDADFTGALLKQVSFVHAFLFGEQASVSGASLRGADFTDACLKEIDFSGVYEKDLLGAIFSGACLVSANFQGTDLGKWEDRGFSFVGAALQGADFTGSNLDGANLTNAAVAVEDPPSPGAQLPITAVYELGDIKITIQPATYTKRTILAPTDDSTYCPSGMGPCTGSKLRPSNPEKSPLEQWPASQSEGKP